MFYMILCTYDVEYHITCTHRIVAVLYKVPPKVKDLLNNINFLIYPKPRNNNTPTHVTYYAHTENLTTDILLSSSRLVVCHPPLLLSFERNKCDRNNIIITQNIHIVLAPHTKHIYCCIHKHKYL